MSHGCEMHRSATVLACKEEVAGVSPTAEGREAGGAHGAEPGPCLLPGLTLGVAFRDDVVPPRGRPCEPPRPRSAGEAAAAQGAS